MVEVSYYCPYCGAVTSIERSPELRDGSVRPQPDTDREYAATTGDLAAADGIEFVCLGDVDAPERAVEDVATSTTGRPDGPIPGKDGCGRTFYLNYYRSPTYDDRLS
ncbi:hypothetical protein Hrd1104_00525 [Halorhabdus sp. CBA1104]|uniref:hypothetical protein n=1 Tax=unclassified Halorhabdus TaxID=2621901 RepID=UPI0012B1FF30|nr:MULTISPECIES: hypothetical protein [unclassified Halorhabdus]QGN05922.1 hypothetical protein Hrd1104_00525 [Halorhabdus sp. CBA1104]